jgi:hypothetical protein
MSDNFHQCKNCGQSFNGNYCNNCGQKPAHRLDTKHILHEIFHVFTHADKGILAFIPIIMFRPGTMALDYVAGKRKSIFNPIQYLIIIVGIVTFIMSKTNYMETIATTFEPPDGQASERVRAVQKQLNGVLQRYLNLFLFALLPVFSFFSWVFFRSKKYNYAENFVLQVAIQAQINTWSLLMLMPLTILLPKQYHVWIIPASFSLLIVCNAVGNRQFFKTSWLQATAKGILVYICTNIIQLIITLLAVVVILMNYKK